MKNWIYYSIYVPNFHYLENVLISIVSPILQRVKEETTVYRWFFIRYVDLQGPHIRLRFLVDETCEEQVEELIEEMLDEGLTYIISKPEKIMPRLLQFPPQETEFEVAFDREDYEPEYDKYGGIEGVEIAEKCFESSSELIIQLLHHDEIDRFDMALLLMKLIVKQAEFHRIEEMAMWNKVLSYWSGSNNKETSKMEQRLVEAVGKRADTIAMRLDSISNNHNAQVLVSSYKKVLKESFTQVRESNTIPVPIEHLVFHYIHMMNNRLGISPTEEAYLGAMLLHHVKQEVAGNTATS